MEAKSRQKILIVDDSELNRAILADMLGEEYEILEAENGVQAVAAIQKLGAEIALVLLDIVMPEMDGFGVLEIMGQQHWIEDIPVIMITAELDPAHVGRAYELGVTDFITRPFDALIVHRRAVNTILLYAKQKRLIGLVADQIYEKQQQSALMIDVFSHIVEFRNGESGLHVIHVRTLTELLLERLVQKTDRYHLTNKAISVISTASALHDIGKIAIDERILNKPGRLTDEEFAVMKTHSAIGGEMLRNMPIHQDDPLVKAAYEICRWHHERWDGRGYPDGLTGDQIPISAQIVSLADVYDALTSRRVYKPPFPPDKSLSMILSGQCGAFNPLLLECLQEIQEDLRWELEDAAAPGSRWKEQAMQSVVQEMHRYEDLTASERTLHLLEHERMKYAFFASLTQELQFEFTLQPPIVTLSPLGAEKLGLDEVIMDPLGEEKFRTFSPRDQKNIWTLADMLRSTTPEQPVVQLDCQLSIQGELRWSRIVARATWSSDEPPRYMGAIGKAIDIHDSRMKLNALEQMASHDALTGLLNHTYAKKRILKRLESRPGGAFALAIFDLDRFKSANDTYGHTFGDRVLAHVAEKLRQAIRGGDIAARVGGDEFLIFLEYKDDPAPVVSRIFDALCGVYDRFTISVSMGVAQTSVVGVDYETLFHAADQALYTVKRSGRGRFCFYDGTMRETLSEVSAISPIDTAVVPAETPGDADTDDTDHDTHKEVSP